MIWQVIESSIKKLKTTVKVDRILASYSHPRQCYLANIFKNNKIVLSVPIDDRCKVKSGDYIDPKSFMIF